MKYEIYCEGENIVGYETLEEVTKYLRSEYNQRVEDERYDMERYPEFYGDANYDPAEGVLEYMQDVYQVCEVIPLPKLL